MSLYSEMGERISELKMENDKLRERVKWLETTNYTKLRVDYEVQALQAEKLRAKVEEAQAHAGRLSIELQSSRDVFADKMRVCLDLEKQRDDALLEVDELRKMLAKFDGDKEEQCLCGGKHGCRPGWAKRENGHAANCGCDLCF